MKRTYILIILLFLCAYSVSAQQPNLNEIHFEGTQITSISGDQLLPVEGKPLTWKINIESNTVETFKLVSHNTSKIDYIFSGDYVVYTDNSGVQRSNAIPYLRNGKQFFQSAALEIKKDILPITVTCGNNVIATFELPSPAKNYQKIEPFKKDTIYVGGIIRLTYSEGKNLVKVKETTVHLKAKDSSYSFEGEEIIAKDVEPGEYKVVVDLTFEDGNSSDNIDCGSVCVLEEINPLISFFIEHLFLLIIVCFIVFIAIITFVPKKKIQDAIEHIKLQFGKRDIAKSTHSEECGNVLKKKIQDAIEHIKLRLSKRDIAKSTHSEECGNNVDSFNIDHNHDVQQQNEEKPIEDGHKEIENFQEDLYKQTGKLQLPFDNVGQTLITPVNDSDPSSLKETIQTIPSNAQNYLDKIDEQADAINRLEQKIKALTGKLVKLVKERQRFEKDLEAALRDKESLKNIISQKNDVIYNANKEKETWKTKFSIESNKSFQLQARLNSFSKQTHYVYAIDDALCMVDNSLKNLFATVNDSNLMKRLTQPILSGTAGLDSGLETYLSDWRNLVYDNQERFFGGQVLNMKDDDVKNKLIIDYLEPLALRDSFGKLVRLYLMTNVGWINEQMVKAGFDVDAIQTLFAQFKNLFTYFGIVLSYPHLFIDKFDPNLHKDNMRCEIFNYFEPSEELRSRLSSREYENLIVDVTRIGIPSSKTSARKMAMVSLPNF